MRRKHSWLVMAILVACACMLVLAPTRTLAKGVFEHQDTVVPLDQTVDDVVVVGGNVTVDGTVNDSVIVLNGDVELKATARVNGFVLVLGGTVKQEQGAFIADELINLSLDSATQNGLLIGGAMVMGTWLLQLSLSLLAVILSVVVALAAKGRLLPFAQQARREPGRVLYTGLLGCLILIAAALLLIVTIIGIPIAIVLMLATLAAVIFGLAVLGLLVGRTIQGAEGRADWQTVLAGSAILVAFMNVPLIGMLMFLGVIVFTVGLGGLWGVRRSASAARRGRSGPR